jgi:hypothetical protein
MTAPEEKTCGTSDQVAKNWSRVHLNLSDVFFPVKEQCFFLAANQRTILNLSFQLSEQVP